MKGSNKLKGFMSLVLRRPFWMLLCSAYVVFCNIGSSFLDSNELVAQWLVGMVVLLVLKMLAFAAFLFLLIQKKKTGKSSPNKKSLVFSVSSFLTIGMALMSTDSFEDHVIFCILYAQLSLLEINKAVSVKMAHSFVVWSTGIIFAAMTAFLIFTRLQDNFNPYQVTALGSQFLVFLQLTNPHKSKKEQGKRGGTPGETAERSKSKRISSVKGSVVTMETQNVTSEMGLIEDFGLKPERLSQRNSQCHHGLEEVREEINESSSKHIIKIPPIADLKNGFGPKPEENQTKKSSSMIFKKESSPELIERNYSSTHNLDGSLKLLGRLKQSQNFDSNDSAREIGPQLQVPQHIHFSSSFMGSLKSDFGLNKIYSELEYQEEKFEGDEESSFGGKMNLEQNLNSDEKTEGKPLSFRDEIKENESKASPKIKGVSSKVSPKFRERLSSKKPPLKHEIWTFGPSPKRSLVSDDPDAQVSGQIETKEQRESNDLPHLEGNLRSQTDLDFCGDIAELLPFPSVFLKVTNGNAQLESVNQLFLDIFMEESCKTISSIDNLLGSMITFLEKTNKMTLGSLISKVISGELNQNNFPLLLICSYGTVNLNRSSGSHQKWEIWVQMYRGNNGTYLTIQVLDLADSLQVNRLREEVMNSFSHELRTPLNLVSSTLGMLTKNKEYSSVIPNEFLSRFVVPAYYSNKLVCLFISGMIDYARTLSGNYRPQYTTRNIRSALEGVKKLFLPQAELKKLPICIEFSQNAPVEWTTDWSLVKKILIELVTNSLKFTQKGNIVISYSKNEEGQLSLCVQDTGIGMQERELVRLENYLRNDFIQHKISKSSSGIGIGIVMVRTLLQTLNGEQAKIDIGANSTGFSIEFNVINPISEGKNLKSLGLDKKKAGNFLDPSQKGPIESLRSDSQAEKLSAFHNDPLNKCSIKQLGNLNSSSHLEPGLPIQASSELRVLPLNQPSLFEADSSFNHGFSNDQYQFSFDPPNRSTIQVRISRKMIRNTASVVGFENEDPTSTIKLAPEDCNVDNNDSEEVNLKVPVFKNSRKIDFGKHIFSTRNISKTTSCTCSKVLIVDDEAYNREILKLHLKKEMEREVLEIIEATDGEEGLREFIRIIGESKCDLRTCQVFLIIFLDINMPKMNGAECCKKIREAERKYKLQKQTIVCYSAYDYKERLKEFQFDFFAPKPLTRGTVKEIASSLYINSSSC